jgi:hypothetical protein
MTGSTEKGEAMSSELIQRGLFAGVNVNDAFALAAMRESAVIVDLGPIAWPANLGPVPQPLSNYKPGDKITGALNTTADVLILLYTDPEISALLDVFTQNKAWTPARKQTWYPYAHNFDKYKSMIEGLRGDVGLEQGILGYLYAMKIGSKNVVLYKSELHPKANGTKLPFVPVIAQLVSELKPKLVVSTGTAGAIGGHLNCGDVAITSSARFRCRNHYPSFPEINTMSQHNTELKNDVHVNDAYIKYASAHFTKLSLPGLAKCYSEIGTRPEYAFLKKNTQAPAIYATTLSPVPGTQPMDIVSGDFLTVDDNNNSEGLQSLGIMNDTDDAFAFFAINQSSGGTKPHWLSIRNASEPQIKVTPFPAGTSPTQIIDVLKSKAGAIYGVYQYCTTLNSAFACWGVVAGMN